MLDIKFIRENADLVKEAARKKHIDFDTAKLLEADDWRLKILKEVEEMRAKQNVASDNIAKIQEAKEKQKAIVEMKDLKEKLLARVEELRKANDVWREMMFQVPNIPHVSVPEGESDAQNVETKTWGKIPDFKKHGFEPKGHIELMQKLKMIDLERGVKVSGFRGYFLKGDGALLSLALVQFVFNKIISEGFEPFIAPSMVREENLVGTSYLPQAKDEIYFTQDDLFLAGTAEVAMMGRYKDEIFKAEKLPKKMVAFSPCFRREAGSYGKDTKGLVRVHEFYKIEQVVICEASHEESVKWHEKVTENAEKIMQELGIPYRIVLICGGDLGLGQVKKYDIEAWVPSENKYLETHSSSYFHDFQTRRLNIRYQDKNGKLHFAHSLNNTAIATPRILVPLVENYQQADGSVLVPEVLRKYIGKEKIS